MSQPHTVRVEADEIDAASYVELISLLRETNRCPGGARTIHEIGVRSGIRQGSLVVEVGSNTGFTSRELRRQFGCRTVGLDPVATAVAEATRLGRGQNDLDQAFVVGDGRAIPVRDSSADLVVCGGATSFIDGDREQARKEYARVLRSTGLLSVTPLGYRTSPPTRILDRVSEALGFSVEPRTLVQWAQFFCEGGFELLSTSVHPLVRRTDDIVVRYVDELVGQPHLASLTAAALSRLRQRTLAVFQAFNENHAHLEFGVMLFRPGRAEMQAELFIEAGAFDPWFSQEFVR